MHIGFPVGSFRLSTVFDFALVAEHARSCEILAMHLSRTGVGAIVIRSIAGFYDFSANFAKRYEIYIMRKDIKYSIVSVMGKI